MSIKISYSRHIIDTLSSERLWSYYKKIQRQILKGKYSDWLKTVNPTHNTRTKEYILKHLDEQTINKILQLYYDNIVLSQKAYMLLHLFEISLRNKIDAVLKKEVSSNWLEDNNLNLSEKFKEDISKAIQDIEKKIAIRKKNNHSENYSLHDSVIPELNFGFWCSILRSQNKGFWNKDRLSSLFQNLKSDDINLELIRRDINIIQKFRNRIAHYEPIHPLMWFFKQTVPHNCNVRKVSVPIKGKNKKGEETIFKTNYVHYNANQIIQIIRKYLCNDLNKIYDEYLRSQL